MANRDIYAAILVAHSFQIFMAIAAHFNLELKQYDAVNAFIHAPLSNKIYMQMPISYHEKGKVYQLNRALYELRELPILWQQHFTGTLINIKLKPIPHKSCCLTSDDEILIFFYVNNIVLAYQKSQEFKAKKILTKLKNHNNISNEEDL